MDLPSNRNTSPMPTRWSATLSSVLKALKEKEKKKKKKKKKKKVEIFGGRFYC